VTIDHDYTEGAQGTLYHSDLTYFFLMLEEDAHLQQVTSLIYLPKYAPIR
jgi:hypothetical protein